MAEVQNVKIVATKRNKYTTIARACLTAMNAAADINEREFYDMLQFIFDEATECVKHLDENKINSF